MSLMVRLGIRGLWWAILEMLVFLGLSAVYFLLLPRWVVSPFGVPVPVWVWIVLGALYLLIVTIWWAPGADADNETELHAMAIVFAVVLLAGAVYAEYQHGAVSGVASEFWEILRTRGGQR